MSEGTEICPAERVSRRAPPCCNSHRETYSFLCASRAHDLVDVPQVIPHEALAPQVLSLVRKEHELHLELDLLQLLQSPVLDAQLLVIGEDQT